MQDKSKRPPWFDNRVWRKFTHPSKASLDDNKDVILSIFKYFNLDPKVHNKFEPEEEDMVSDNPTFS